MRTSSSAFFDQSVLDLVFPESLELLPFTHELFELEFALGELEALTEQQLVKRSGFFARVQGKPTWHFQLCANTPIEEIRSGKTIRVRSFFEANRFSTAYATHSLFPYRGKFHPQLIKGILNVVGVEEGETILDPMSGSGTACIEAQLMNINAIGVDINPFCTLLTRAKSLALNLDIVRLQDWVSEEDMLKSIETLKALLDKATEYDNLDHFFSDVSITGDSRTDLTILMAFLDAVGYSRRRKTGSIENLFSAVLKRYFHTISSFNIIRDELGIEFGGLKASTGNALALALPDNSVDAVITSPPYSFAIDYAENDRPQLELLGIDVDALKTVMIGLRGNDRPEKVKSYFQDMNEVIGEISRVLKSGRFCVIIVGSNELQTGGIRHDTEFCSFAKNKGLVLRRDLVKSIEGIQNSMRREHVLFFQKQ